MTNTYTYKENFDTAYQITLYRQPVYRAIAREAIAPKLHEGQTLSRNYITNFYVSEMGADGSYSAQAFTATPEVLTVDQKPEVSANIVKWQEFLDDLDTRNKIAQDAMSRIFNYIDGRVLGAVTAGAGSTIDNALYGGSAGDGITITTSNVMQLFVDAQSALIMKNAFQGQYSPVKKFTGIKMQDTGDRMPIAIIDAMTYTKLQLAMAGKYTPMGDRVTTNGFVDMIFGFNIFVSNNLRFVGVFDGSANLTNGNTITIGGLTITMVTGTPSSAGEVLVESSATDTITNIKNALNSPFTSISGKHVAWTKASLDAGIVTMLKNLTATSSTSTLTITVDGNSNLLLTETSDGSWTKKYSNLIFGTSQMIDLAIVKEPSLEEVPVSGKVSRDLVVWTLGGWKVFHDQSPRIVKALVNTSSYTQAPAY